MAALELDSLNINDGTAYRVLQDTIDLGDPDERTNRRVISMDLVIYGASVDALIANEQALQDKLIKADQASRAVRDGSVVAFSFTPGTYANTFDLAPFVGGEYAGRCGYLRPSPDAVRNLGRGSTKYLRGVKLVMSTVAYGRSATVTDSVSSTLTNGASSLYRASITGNCPALPALTVTDVSTGSKVIQRLRIGQRVAAGMADASWTPWLDATLSSGASTVTVSNTVGGSHARRAASSSWTSIGYVVPSTPTYNKGSFHLFPRYKDSAVILNAPSALTVGSGSPVLLQETTAQLYDESGNDLYTNFDEPVTSGSLLVGVVFAGANSGTLTPPSGFTESISVAHASAGIKGFIAYKESATAGDTGSTWTVSATGNYLYVWVGEFAGMATSSPLDDTGSSATGADVTDAGAQANELAVAGSADADNTTKSFKTPWSVIEQFTGEAATSPFANVALRYLVSTATWSTKLGAGTADITIESSFKAKSTSAGTLPTGVTYEVRVAAMDASNNVGPACTAATYVSPTGSQGSNGDRGASLYCSWTAPSGGTTPTQYRVYFRVADGVWYYVNTGSTATTYSVTSFSSATAGDPPAYTTTRSEFRLRIGLQSGVTLYTTPSWTSEVGGGEWEMPRQAVYSGPLPPRPTTQAGTAENWLVEFQHRNSAGQTHNNDFDAICVMSADAPVLLLEARDNTGAFGSALTAPKTWHYDVRSDLLPGTKWTGETVTVTPANLSVSASTAVFNGTTSTATVSTTTLGLDETQSWLAFRFNATTISNDPLFVWGDDANNILYAYTKASGGLSLGRASAGNFNASSADTGDLGIDDAEDETVILKWDASNFQYSVNGATFVTVGTGAQIPTLASTTLRIGHDNNIFGGGAAFFGGSMHWVAAGTGTLTDGNAATLHAIGNTDPTFDQFATAAALSFLWHCTSTTVAWDGGDEQGQPYHEGRLLLGPGNTELVIAADVASGVSDVTDAKVRVGLALTPRWRYLSSS